MATSPRARVSIHGKRVFLGTRGNFEQKNGNTYIAITPPTQDAAIVVGAASGNVRNITIQLKDGNGNNADYSGKVEIDVLTTNGLAWATTGGSTGLAQGAAGSLLTVVAKKSFLAISNAAGLISLTWTDTTSEALALSVRIATNRSILSAPITTP